MALTAKESRLLYQRIRQFSPSIKEAMILSTCNRTEIYYVSEQEEITLLIKLIGLVKGSDLNPFTSYFRSLNDNSQAMKYLFRVAAGLESKVLGDMQIPYQVKQAYQLSVESNFAGPYLHRLLHTIFFTNKRITQETTFRDGAASVSYTASQLVKQVTKKIRAPKVLVIGLGSIGKDVSKNLLKNEHLDLYISNRTEAKSTALAHHREIEVIPFEQIGDRINQMDVVISSVNVDQPIISKCLLSHNSVCFIDLSVPRSVAPNVSDLPGVELINIDDLKSKVDQTLLERQSAIPAVEAIIEESVRTFLEWTEEVLASPVINRMKNALEQIRKEELSRFMKKGKLEDYQMAEEVTRGMIQKIIKLPVLKLKEACKRGKASTLIETLNELFDLETEQTIK